MQFVRGGLEKLPLKDASVDAAVSVLVLPYVERPREAVAEMRRILRPDAGGGGVALIVDMVEHGREEYRTTMGHQRLGFPVEEMSRMLRGAGFEQVRVQILPPEAGARGPGLFAGIGRVKA